MTFGPRAQMCATFRPFDPWQVQVEQGDVGGHVQPAEVLDGGGVGHQGEILGLFDGHRQAVAV
jgi:hypothetical protein